MIAIKESFKYGWDKARENMEISIFSTLLMVAVGALTGGKGTGRSILGFLAAIFLIIVRIGYTKIFLRITDGDKPKFTDIFSEYRLFWKYLGVSILIPITVFAGLILLIVPGIIWAVRFSLSTFIVVDTKVGPIVAMKESWAITEGSFWSLLLFWIAVGAANIVGFLALGIGLLVSIPVTTFAAIHVYRELSKSKASIIVEAPSASLPSNG